MKTKIYLFLFVTLFISLSACKNVNHNLTTGSCENIIVDISSLEMATFSELIDSVKYIKLKLNQEHPIGTISKIAFHDSLAYILDEKSNKLFVYNRAGDFRFVIDAQGMGPNEYTGIQDFTINPLTSTIDLIDASARKIIRYDMHNGTSVQVINLPEFAYYLLSLSKNEYLFYDRQQKFSIYNIQNEKETIVKKLANVYPYCVNNAQFIYQKGDSSSIGIFSIEDNSLYYYEQGKLERKFAFSFKDYLTPADFPGEIEQSQELANKGAEISILKDMSNWIYMKYTVNKEHKMYSYLYNKNTKKQYAINAAGFPGFILPELVPQEVMDDCLVMTSNDIPIDAFKSQLHILPNTPENEKFKKLINSIGDDDNPLLQIIYLKK